MMLFTRTRGLPVISAEEATALGTVDELTIDAHTRSVAWLRLKGAPKDRAVIGWDAVEAVGHDAVIVRSRPTTGPAPEHREALGSRVLTERGVEHGTVKDIAYDPVSGKLLTLYTALGDIPGHHLIGLGSYAVIVHTEHG